jgi:hypothetical protein
MTLSDVDWCAAACADARVENLTLSALQAAHDVAKTPEEFFWAVHASIVLKETIDDSKPYRKAY